MITVRLCVICGCEMWMTFFQINRKYIVQKIVTLQLSVDILSNLLKIVRCKWSALMLVALLLPLYEILEKLDSKTFVASLTISITKPIYWIDLNTQYYIMTVYLNFTKVLLFGNIIYIFSALLYRSVEGCNLNIFYSNHIQGLNVTSVFQIVLQKREHFNIILREHYYFYYISIYLMRFCSSASCSVASMLRLPPV